MYDSTTAISSSHSSAAPVPAPRPKSEVVVSPPRRSLPPPPVPVPHLSDTFSTKPPATPKRPIPSIPSAVPAPTPAPRIASESAIVPPKRPLPTPVGTTTTHEDESPPKAAPRVPLPLPPRAASTPSLVATKPATDTPAIPALPARSLDTTTTTPSSPSRPVPTTSRPSSTVQLAKPPPRRLSIITHNNTPSSSSHSTNGPTSSLPTPEHAPEQSFVLPKRSVPQLPPTPEDAAVSIKVPLRPVPVAVPKSQQESSPTSQTTPIKVPLRPIQHQQEAPSATKIAPIKVPLRPAPATVPELQQESPPASQSVAELLKKLDVGRHSNGSVPAPLPPSKPPRLPTARVPTPTKTNTTTTTTIKTTSTTSSNKTTKVVEPNPAPTPRPVPRPVPAPPTLPQRPSLPARPTLPQRPSLPQRPDPTIPPRPDLPARPALPKRPGQSAVSSSSSSHSSSSNRTSSHLSSSTSKTSSTGVFRAGDDITESLALCKPVTRAEFCGERMDLSMADFSVMDNHAMACPPSEEESIARLSWYLTSAFPDDQVAQLRSIFKWVAHNIIYNMTGLLSGNRGDNSAEAVLRNKTGVCAGFANLFYELALAAPQNLGVVKIYGVARGHGIEVGGESLGGGHAWNAVTVNGECLLIDSTWGTGGATDADEIPGDRGASFLPHYFLVRPEVLIYSHWPDLTEEQFLNPPVHVDLYRALPYRHPHSWTLGIEPSGALATHTVWTDDDSVEVEIRVVKRPWDGAIPRLMVYLQWPPTGVQLPGLPGQARWSHEDADYVYFTVRSFCPSAGSGTLRVVGQAADADLTKGGSGIVSYKVVNRGTGANMQTMFPPISSPKYGFSIMDPLSTRVKSGISQMIRIRFFNVQPGVQLQLCVNGPMFKRPEMLVQVEANLFETQQTLCPGQYMILNMTVGNSYEVLGQFDAV
ncbi:hypothetical protein BGX23_012152 [Mortierella sp. AD031]|nr:hypothetical protein BGX23_012152 [Mortierella sp. AD031]